MSFSRYAFSKSRLFLVHSPPFSFAFNLIFSSHSHSLPNSTNNIHDAVSSFNRLLLMRPLPSVVQFNKILGAIVKMKQYRTAISLSSRAQSKSITPSLVFLSILINSYSHLGQMYFAFSVLGKILKMVAKGFLFNEVSYGTLVNGLCKAGKTRIAIDVLPRIERQGIKPNIVMYNTIIDGLCKDGLITEARDLCSEMIELGIFPNIVTYSSLVHGFCSMGGWKEAYELLNEMFGKDINPNVYTFTILVDAFCKEGRIIEAQAVFATMMKCDKKPDVVTFNALMDGYCLRNNVDVSREVFNKMVKNGLAPDVISYNILINGYCGRLNYARQVFQQLLMEGYRLNVQSYTCMISGLCKEGFVDEAMALLSNMEENGCLPNLVTIETILRGLLEKNDNDKAKKFLLEMTDRGLFRRMTFVLFRTPEPMISKVENTCVVISL
ncbi:pentatricopeptide repeat-containing protein [Senna tora]|uniref:Pentatricopeptide repeat-containing protein n=1 Tax=Senna tora TaxID=362788 RepID=A0A834W7G6_9FABA|nr:pentatricopeptide repeat-containing protein [Senna tora]